MPRRETLSILQNPRLSRHAGVMLGILHYKHHWFVHCATVTIWYAVRGLDRAGGALCEKPYRIAWMNMKWINIHIAEMHSDHICGTDVYVTPCTLYPPPPHGGHRNARSLLTIQNKREFAGGRWGMRVGSGVDGGELELRWGHFSPVIALCGTSPGGTMTAAEGRHIMIYCPRSPWPKMPNTADENLTYCSKTTWEMHKSLHQLCQSRTSNSLFISQDDHVIYWEMWS